MSPRPRRSAAAATQPPPAEGLGAVLTTWHRQVVGSATALPVADASVQLVVTSPPYPMIEMWDDCFAQQDPAVALALAQGRGDAAFEAMHRTLDAAWAECYRVLQPGGHLCINIGDATRTLPDGFRLYPNHARILHACRQLGFRVLPGVLWRKPTNAPNKFMGSGMLPGAYVTLEHEHILILRKGDKRAFNTPDLRLRRVQSAYFWEERNQWCSDLWDFRGVRQHLKHNDLRTRSAAFPLELPLRLVWLYSIYGDTVLDPFGGMGTTAQAALLTGRNSLLVERDAAFVPQQQALLQAQPAEATGLVVARLERHRQFATTREAEHGPLCHRHPVHGFGVMTEHEAQSAFYVLQTVQATSPNHLEAELRQWL